MKVATQCLKSKKVDKFEFQWTVSVDISDHFLMLHERDTWLGGLWSSRSRLEVMTSMKLLYSLSLLLVNEIHRVEEEEGDIICNFGMKETDTEI